MEHKVEVQWMRKGDGWIYKAIQGGANYNQNVV